MMNPIQEREEEEKEAEVEEDQLHNFRQQWKQELQQGGGGGAAAAGEDQKPEKDRGEEQQEEDLEDDIHKQVRKMQDHNAGVLVLLFMKSGCTTRSFHFTLLTATCLGLVCCVKERLLRNFSSPFLLCPLYCTMFAQCLPAVVVQLKNRHSEPVQFDMIYFKM